jgi:hypothetical protein
MKGPRLSKYSLHCKPRLTPPDNLVLFPNRAISNPTPVSATSENASLPQTPSIATQQAAQHATEPPQDPATRTIQLRCLIVTQDASIIIGKSGRHVNEIRVCLDGEIDSGICDFLNG